MQISIVASLCLIHRPKLGPIPIAFEMEVPGQALGTTPHLYPNI